MRELTRNPWTRAVAIVVCIAASETQASTAPAQNHNAAEPASAAPASARLDILEYYVSGNTVLAPEIIAQACAPFLGKARTPDDVDRARAALEDAYRERGYKTVGVSIPQQTVKDGVVHLDVVESRVGHLNVVGSKFHSIDVIKSAVPSLSEGSVPNFSEVERDIVAINQQADRRVTPALKAGVNPQTVDVDLVVDDDLPLHGTVEVNNRKSQDTTAVRALVSLHYDNLWQRGDSLSLSNQAAPENTKDAQVYYGSYLARFGSSPYTLMISALRSDSDVSTVGGTDVVGNGKVISVRGIRAFPATEHFYSSLSFGLDYKRFKNKVSLDSNSFTTPIEYYPFALGYTGVLREKGSITQFNAGARFAFPGLGSDSDEFGLNRAYARGQQLSVQAGVEHTHNLFAGFEGRFRLSAQISDQALISNEQLSAGGFDSVRGYLEAEALGDSGGIASVEFRSPRLFAGLFEELRLYSFVDSARLRLRDPLPEQKPAYTLASTGVGLDLRPWRSINGTVMWAVPFEDGPASQSGQNRLLFRMWADF